MNIFLTFFFWSNQDRFLNAQLYFFLATISVTALCSTELNVLILPLLWEWIPVFLKEKCRSSPLTHCTVPDWPSIQVCAIGKQCTCFWAWIPIKTCNSMFIQLQRISVFSYWTYCCLKINKSWLREKWSWRVYFLFHLFKVLWKSSLDWATSLTIPIHLGCGVLSSGGGVSM